MRKSPSLLRRACHVIGLYLYPFPVTEIRLEAPLLLPSGMPTAVKLENVTGTLPVPEPVTLAESWVEPPVQIAVGVAVTLTGS